MSLTTSNVYWSSQQALCERDFPYLCSKYLHIKGKDVIGFPTLQFSRTQQYLFDRMFDQWKRTGYVRQVYLKARQVYASTLCRALAFWQAAFHDNRNLLCVLHDEPTAVEVFDYDQTFYDSLPAQLRPQADYRSKFKMDFPQRNSKSLANHARNMNVGIAGMNHFVHLSEVARYPDPKEVQASIFPTISQATSRERFGEHSFVILESTAFLGGEWFKSFAEAARDGESEYEFTFVPWYMHEKYSLPVPSDFRPTAEEEVMLRSFPGLTRGNLVWRRREMQTYRMAGNTHLFVRDYPFSDSEAWALPEGTDRVFDDQALEHIASFLRPGKRAFVSSAGLTFSIGGDVEVWAEPVEGCYYDMGIDLAEGRTSKADWTVLEIIRRDTLEQVAEARLHIDPASAEFFDLVYWLGMIYNRAVAIPDITGGWGHALLQELQRRSYPNLWQWRRPDDAKERVSQRVGFLYTKREKALLVNNAIRAMINFKPIIHSQVLYDELCNFLSVGEEEWMGRPGFYDDAVNSWMLAVKSATDERRSGAPILAEPTKSERPAWAYQDIDAELAPAGSPLGSFLTKVTRQEDSPHADRETRYPR